MRQKHQAKAGKPGKRVSASEFKTHCLSLMDLVKQTREAITVTKYGRPVAKLVPLTTEDEPIFGYLKGAVGGYGDLITPLEEAWEAGG